MPQAPWKIRISADGAGTLAAVHATVELVNRASGCPQLWGWWVGDDLTGYAAADPVTGITNRGFAGPVVDLLAIDRGAGDTPPTYDPDVVDGRPGFRSGGALNAGMAVEGLGSIPFGTSGVTIAVVTGGPFNFNDVLQIGLSDGDPSWSFPDTWTDLEVGQFGLQGAGVWLLSGGDEFGEIWYPTDVSGAVAVVASIDAAGNGVLWVNGTQAAAGVNIDVPATVASVVWGFGPMDVDAATSEAVIHNAAIDPDADLFDLGGCRTLHGYLAGRYPSLFT